MCSMISTDETEYRERSGYIVDFDVAQAVSRHDWSM
jgi:hypothetical protein